MPGDGAQPATVTSITDKAAADTRRATTVMLFMLAHRRADAELPPGRGPGGRSCAGSPPGQRRGCDSATRRRMRTVAMPSPASVRPTHPSSSGAVPPVTARVPPVPAVPGSIGATGVGPQSDQCCGRGAEQAPDPGRARGGAHDVIPQIDRLSKRRHHSPFVTALPPELRLLPGSVGRGPAADARAEGQYQPVDCEWPHAPHGVP